MYNFFFFYLLQLLQSAIVTYNWRAISATNFPHAIGSEVLWAMTNFFIIKRVASSPKCGWAMAGYTCGAVTGLVIAMLLTRHL